MPAFSRQSLHRLRTCDPRLQRLFERVVLDVDCSILGGHRGEQAQNEAFEDGLSQLKWPEGKHNAYPSRAVDVAPYPIDWKNIKRFYWFSGYVLGVAQQMRIPLRWGGDWDRDDDLDDQDFNDLPHFEIYEEF